MAHIFSVLCAGALIAFALIYYGAVEDAGRGAFGAFVFGAVAWGMALSDRRTAKDRIDDDS